MTPTQLLKAYGKLKDKPLSDIVDNPLPYLVLEQMEELALRHCGVPDDYDDEIADAKDLDTLASQLGVVTTEAGALRLFHRRLRNAEAGSGSYPAGCNPAYKGLHAIAYYDDPKDWPKHLNRTLTDKEFQEIIDSKVWGPSGDPHGEPFTMKQLKDTWGNSRLNEVVNDFAEETYRRQGVVLYPVFTGPNGQHNIHVSYPVIAGSTIGLGWYPDNTACPGDHVNLHIDKTYTAGFQGQFGLKIHELGHTLQLKHQFNNQNYHQEPMSYRYSNHLVVGYSDGSEVFGIPKSPSIDILARLYDDHPVSIPWKGKFLNTPTDPEKPTPPTDPDLPQNPPNGTVAIDGELWKIWLERAT